MYFEFRGDDFMTWILGRTIFAGVIVLGIAGCAAPKNSGQTSKQVSGVPSTQVPHQVSPIKQAPQKEMSAKAGLVQVSVKLLTSLKEDQERDALNNRN